MCEQAATAAAAQDEARYGDNREVTWGKGGSTTPAHRATRARHGRASAPPRAARWPGRL